jgi:hypothetical protein
MAHRSLHHRSTLQHAFELERDSSFNVECESSVFLLTEHSVEVIGNSLFSFSVRSASRKGRVDRCTAIGWIRSVLRLGLRCVQWVLYTVCRHPL